MSMEMNLTIVPSESNQKICSVCKKEKPLVDFPKNKNNTDGVAARCKPCHNAIGREYAKKFPEKAKARWQKSNANPKTKANQANYHLINKYGITLEQKEKMLSLQHNTCAICPTHFDTHSDAHVDHDHNTNIVRGLLCHPCNIAIGLLKEDPHRIENIRLYLSKSDNNFAKVSKFASYLREREGVDTIETREGYATYSISGDECLIKDIFVLPEYRRKKFASSIADRISEIAKIKGCKFLTGTVCPSANGANASLLVLLGYGMRLHSSQSNLIIFIKDL